MSIRPIDMQISIAAMNANNQAHQQAHQVGANAHANVANIKKEQEHNKETVKNTNDTRKVKATEENGEDKQKQKRENKKPEKDDKDLTEEERKEKEEEAKKEAEKKKRYIYTLRNDGKLELRPEDTEAESEGAGHIDYKA